MSNLKPSTIYTVQVESRRESRRTDDITADMTNEDRVEYKFISYSKSNLMQFQTASPPDPPTNLSVVTTTCHAIKICWDPPIDHGSEIIGKFYHIFIFLMRNHQSSSPHRSRFLPKKIVLILQKKSTFTPKRKTYFFGVKVQFFGF